MLKPEEEKKKSTQNTQKEHTKEHTHKNIWTTTEKHKTFSILKLIFLRMTCSIWEFVQVVVLKQFQLKIQNVLQLGLVLCIFMFSCNFQIHLATQNYHRDSRTPLFLLDSAEVPHAGDFQLSPQYQGDSSSYSAKAKTQPTPASLYWFIKPYFQ